MDDKNEFIEQPNLPQPNPTQTNPILNVIPNRCNSKDVRRLKRLLSGRISEMTLFNTYLFQSLLNQNNSELKNQLINLYNQKLRHINLIGDAIISFGGIPRFSNGEGNFWSARYINYLTNLQNYILNNINRERLLIREYQRAITQTTNQSLINLYNQFIEDSNSSIQILNSIL